MKFGPEYRTLKSGLTVEFRSATAADAQDELDYLKAICGETPYLLSEPEEVNYTLGDEEKYIGMFEDAPEALMVNAYVNGRLAGNASFEPKARAARLRHRAEMGIALYAEFCGFGIGAELMGIMLGKAKECGYELMELEVYSNNTRAISMYKKFGFEECGRIRNAVRYKDGSYTDLIPMQRAI